MLELNRLYLMDCMEGMWQYPDGYFELAIVDPPYGIGAEGGTGRGPREKFGGANCGKHWDVRPGPEYFAELRRVSKNQIIWGGNYFDLPPTRCFVVWDKGETMYLRNFAECELAWTSFDRNARIYKYSPHDKNRIHPTQKPVALYEFQLRTFARPGDKIIDTHVGSASSLVACHNLGFDFVGFETDGDYYFSATERLDAVRAQMRLC